MSTDRDWEKWGKTDPYFGVLTHERFRADSIDANRDDFFATGHRDVEAILARFNRSFGAFPQGSVLDFGCGVGRLALAFARHFERVVGLDISQSMLAEAELNAKRLVVENVKFQQSDDLLSAAPGQYDFVNSLIVLQHIPIARGLPIMARLLDRVRPGGGCMLHVSIARWGQTPLRRFAYSVREHVPMANAVVNVAIGQPAGCPMMQMNEYPLPAVLKLFTDRGMSEMMMNADDHAGVATVSITARRPNP